MEYHVPTPTYDRMDSFDRARVRRKIFYMSKRCIYCGQENDRYPTKHCSKCAKMRKKYYKKKKVV
ncbi:hypothetical protein [Defluviitalea saccharophila]|uniref:50S ribosomal protein L40e n=1 Tax=Defluviitalea saccharophila TaxID=879970 RepID=A0ABZ2Y6V9_9FIRM